MTHKECVESATYWLQGKCDVVLPEFFTWNDELCDVIGFGYKYSTMIECKIGRGDFLKDKKKTFRAYPERGMGDLRYYCCPKGLIKPEELPDKWGLIYIYPSGYIKRVKEASIQPKNVKSEAHLLFYYARRAQQANVHNIILAHRVG